MQIQFTKMSGAGNDFVVVDNRQYVIKEPSDFAKKTCERRFGIGADGILLLETHPTLAFEMKYYNADGSNAGMCGNGGRCLAKFAYDIGAIASPKFNFMAFGNEYLAVRHGMNDYELKMIEPHSMVLDQHIKLALGDIKGHYLNTGTDHSVVLLEENPGMASLEGLDVVAYGRPMRYHEVYQPKGANINFIMRSGDNAIKIRTYERGVEDETLACGTGSVASALIGSIRYGMVSPVSVLVKSGEILSVTFEKDQRTFRNVYLRGSAIETFKGVIEI